MNSTLRESLAEFFGTFTLVLFGTAVVAQVVLSDKSHGEYLSINLGWGLAVTMGVFIAGGISGGHLNPAVTLSLAVRNKFPWPKLPAYCAAQLAGAFAASAVTFLVYREALNAFDPGRTIPGMGSHATAGIWATYPAAHLSTFPGGLIDQIVGTAMLVACATAIGDLRNMGTPSYLAPLCIGALVLLIGMTFGFNSGYAINPARDVAPRLFTAIAGWGWGVFDAGNHWWWVPIVGPLIGGVIGGHLYDMLIGDRMPPAGG